MTEVLEPALHDPITLAEVKDHLRIDHREEDTYLLHLVKTATQWMERYCGRSLLRRKLRYVCTQSESMMLAMPSAYQTLYLPYPPVINVEEVNELLPNGKHALKRVSYALNTSRPYIMVGNHRKHTEVIYWAGYTDNPRELPEDLKHMVLVIVQELYQRHALEPVSHRIFKALQCYRILT